MADKRWGRSRLATSALAISNRKASRSRLRWVMSRVTLVKPSRRPLRACAAVSKMLANNFVAAVALYFLGAFVPTADGSLGIQHEDGVILYLLHQQTKTLFAQPLRLFSRLAFGNVADGGGNQQTIGDIQRA